MVKPHLYHRNKQWYCSLAFIGDQDSFGHLLGTGSTPHKAFKRWVQVLSGVKLLAEWTTS